MKKSLLIAVLFVCSSVFSYSLYAQNTEVKFGVVDLQAVILKVNDGKKAKEQLQKEVDKKEAELKKEKEKIEELGKKVQSQVSILSDEAKMEKQKEIQERIIKHQNAVMSFQNDIKKKEQEITQKITQKVSKIVDALAKEKDFTAVFELNSAGLLYVKNAVDLTDEVVKKYDDKKATKK